MQAYQITSRLGLAASVSSLAMVMMVMSVPAPAAQGEEAPGAQTSLATFTKLDANHDGFVDLSEARKMPGLLEIFDQLDANHDGKLSAEEFAQAQAHAKKPGG